MPRMAPIAATAMRAAMRPYSMAVAPLLFLISLMNLLMVLLLGSKSMGLRPRPAFHVQVDQGFTAPGVEKALPSQVTQRLKLAAHFRAKTDQAIFWPVAVQSLRKLARPASVSGCLNSCQI